MWRPRQLKIVVVVLCCAGVFVVHEISEHLVGKDIKHIDKTQKHSLTGVKGTKQSTMLIILTYMRSGSSFTGAIVQRHPDVFYVFEPLHDVERQNRLAGGKQDYLQRQLSTLEGFLTCNTSMTDASTLAQGHMKNSPDTYPYYTCSRDKYQSKIANCTMLLQNACKKSRVSSVKVIRIGVKNVTHLMSKYDNMKVLHLIRDPRATMLSQNSVGYLPWADLGPSAKQFCTRVKQDIEDSKEMRRRFPGRIATMRYEDLAEKPIIMAKEIFDFIDLELTDKIKSYIKNITHKTNDVCDALCVKRDSKEIISKWRLDLSLAKVSFIDKICQPLFDVMGYLPAVSDDSLRNLSVPLYNQISSKFHIY
ncbi:carbohydrate sulfotransferase 1-like [Haliotis cracherodii]|uniref:carbohydrate sulfotransferase 1-like n=1 Tax=Haliotis cracherodii TaxID=6455 RepID=UPI0039EC8FEE